MRSRLVELYWKGVWEGHKLLRGVVSTSPAWQHLAPLRHIWSNKCREETWQVSKHRKGSRK